MQQCIVQLTHLLFCNVHIQMLLQCQVLSLHAFAGPGGSTDSQEQKHSLPGRGAVHQPVHVGSCCYTASGGAGGTRATDTRCCGCCAPPASAPSPPPLV